MNFSRVSRSWLHVLSVVTLVLAGSVMAEQPSPSFPVDQLMVKGGVFATDLAEAKGPTIVGRQGVVVSGNAQATLIGYDIIRKGGNAFDAGVATAAALQVTKYHHAGWAGITPFIGFSASEGVVAAYAGVGTSPAAATFEYFNDPAKGWRVMGDARGNLDLTLMPTQIDTFIAILERWGTMSFTEVFQGALELAEYGFPAYIFHVSAARTRNVDQFQLAGDEYGLEYWQPGGRPPELGEYVVNKDLANSFKLMIAAEQEALRAGLGRSAALEAARDVFYKGEIARTMADWFEAREGLLTYDDLANYRGRWFEEGEIPTTTFMGVEVYAAPEWTQCGVMIQVFNILENFDLQAMGWNTPDYIHVVTQAFNLAMADRWQYYGDPDFVDIPQGLYSKEYGAIRARLIDMDRAFAVMPPPGDPVNMQALLAADLVVPHPILGPIAEHEDFAVWAPNEGVLAASTSNELLARTPDTTYLGVIDREGNVFSMTPSDGHTVPHRIIPGIGIGMGTRMTQFTLHDPSHTHAVAPNKRPMVTPNPALGVKDGKGFFAIGTPGSDQQPQAMIQVFLNTILWDMSEQMAVDQPRFGSYNFYGAFSPYPYAPGAMNIEDAFSAEVEQALVERGHTVRRWDPGVGPTTWLAGSIGFITRDPVTGLIRGGADARRESFGAGW